MISALVSLKSFIKNKSYHIDHPVFRLHYQATVCGLLGFCLILTAKILFGDTIDCKGSDRDDFYDNLCYSLGTFTSYAIDENCTNVESILAETPTTALEFNDISQSQSTVQVYVHDIVQETIKQQFRLAHRAFRNPIPCYSSDIKYLYSGIEIPKELSEPLSFKIWHRYYRYIPIILFLQAVFFYFPHYLWKLWENGIVSSVCKQLHDHRFSPNDFIESNYHIIDYLQSCFTLNKSLVYKYFFCHILLLTNLIAQIIALNGIFNNQFITYGIDVMYYLFVDSYIYGLEGTRAEGDKDLNHPMDYIFPKVTACTAEYLSSAGRSTNEIQFLCVLPLNILHDKFFLVLWFWLLILAFITVIQLIYDVLCFALPSLRKYLFVRKYGSYSPQEDLAELFILDLIGSNSDKFAFSALIKELQIVRTNCAV